MDIRYQPELPGGSTDATSMPGRRAAARFRSLDHAKEALIARATGGLSPAALTLALPDWLVHLLAAPGK